MITHTVENHPGSMSSDKFGREYLRIDRAKDGQFVELDGGFTCRSKGRAMLYSADGQLYFFCDNGMHFLSGQTDDGVHCVGVYPQAYARQ